MVDALLQLRSLAVGFKSDLISNLNIEVFPGDIIAITGDSGLGKTTLLRVIAGLISPRSGEVIRNTNPRGGIGYIPQRLGLVRHASVYHNVDLGARAGVPIRCDEGSKLSWSKRRSIRVKDAVEALGISEKLHEPIRRLSGGQQRRVATARTLAQRPKLILADEFLSELDDNNIDQIVEVFHNLVKDNSAAILLVEHDLERAKKISNRMFVLSSGTLVEVDRGGLSE